MSARIYTPARTAMQSGKANTGQWIVEFEARAPKTVEPLMGYTSSRDTLAQVRLYFDTREQAIAYAEREGIAYQVIEPKPQERRRVAYADNFRYDRIQPWTH